MMKALRIELLAWSFENLAGKTIKLNIFSKLVTVRITKNGIKKTLRDVYNQEEAILNLVQTLNTGIFEAIYIGPELRKHEEQTSIKCYHRFRWLPANLNGKSIDILLRELNNSPEWEFYFFHPTKK